jgi:hypothetical protein
MNYSAELSISPISPWRSPEAKDIYITIITTGIIIIIQCFPGD